MKTLILFSIIISSSFNIYIENSNIVENVLECDSSDCNHNNHNYEVEQTNYLEPIDPNPPSFITLSNTYHPDKSFTTNYFRNLKNNMFRNVGFSDDEYPRKFVPGKCPFVAIGMLLSYYDVYWNDNIIPNVYQNSEIVSNLDDNSDFDSPGISDNWDIYYTTPSNQADLSPQELTNIIWNFINQAESLKDTSYLAYLINIAKNYNIFNANLQTSFGLPATSVQILVNAIFSNNLILSQNTTLNYMSQYNGYSNTQIWNKAISLVQQGIPAMVTSPGHSYVIYDYKNGDLIANLGYKEYHTQASVSVTQGFESIYEMFYFDISDTMPHVHNTLYKPNDSSAGQCSCRLLSHSHINDYATHNDVNHKYKCRCEFFTSFSEHIYATVELIDNHYYAICNKCNYSKLVDEDFVPMV